MIGKEIKDKVFRESNSCYFTADDSVAMSLIKFAQKHAGHSILDYGCATGNYSVQLSHLGYDVKGVDTNQEYIEIAQKKGVDASLVKDKVPMPDKSFDTVIAFEVLEHLADPQNIILEAKRLARENVIITVPNCEGMSILQNSGLLFEHVACLDHINYFTKDSLRDLLQAHFSNVQIWEGDHISPVVLIDSAPIRFMGRVLKKIGLVHSRFSFRLFALAKV